MGIIFFRVIPFFLFGKSIISYWILKIDLKMVNANDSKFTQITLSLPKCSYKQRNLNVYLWSCHRFFCARTICKHLCDIVLFCILGKCWYLFFSFVIYLFSALYVHYAIIVFSELAFFFRNGNVTKDC